MNEVCEKNILALSPYAQNVFDIFKILLVQYSDRRPDQLMKMAKDQTDQFYNFIRQT